MGGAFFPSVPEGTTGATASRHLAALQGGSFCRKMSLSKEFYIEYEGLLLPTETHSLASVKFAQEFHFKDDDVIAVTYPKSGQCFFVPRDRQETVPVGIFSHMLPLSQWTQFAN